MKITTSILLFSFSILLLLACNTKKTTTNTPTPDDGVFIKNEIIVQLKKGVTPRQLVAAHEKYKLETMKAVVKITNMWLFTYDTKLIDPDKLLKILRDSELTIEAEFNKNLNRRSGRE